MGRVLAFMNLKGGVGKTTLAAQFARAIADDHKKSVLLLDLDPQCNLSQLFIEPDALDRPNERSIYDAFVWQGTLKQPPDAADPATRIYPLDERADVAKPIAANGAIDLVKGSFRLFELAVIGLLPNLQSAAKEFGRFVARAKTKYDVIIIDTNPSGTFSTLCALAVSDFLVAPSTFDRFSPRGIHLIVQTLSTRYAWLSKPGRIAVVPNKITRPRNETETGALSEVENEMRRNFPELRFSILGNKIYESKFLSIQKERRGFVADRRSHRYLQRVLEEISSSVAELMQRLEQATDNAPTFTTTLGQSLQNIFGQIDLGSNR